MPAMASGCRFQPCEVSSWAFFYSCCPVWPRLLTGWREKLCAGIWDGFGCRRTALKMDGIITAGERNSRRGRAALICGLMSGNWLPGIVFPHHSSIPTALRRSSWSRFPRGIATSSAKSITEPLRAIARRPQLSGNRFPSPHQSRRLREVEEEVPASRLTGTSLQCHRVASHSNPPTRRRRAPLAAARRCHPCWCWSWWRWSP